MVSSREDTAMINVLTSLSEAVKELVSSNNLILTEIRRLSRNHDKIFNLFEKQACISNERSNHSTDNIKVKRKVCKFTWSFKPSNSIDSEKIPSPTTQTGSLIPKLNLKSFIQQRQNQKASPKKDTVSKQSSVKTKKDGQLLKNKVKGIASNQDDRRHLWQVGQHEDSLPVEVPKLRRLYLKHKIGRLKSLPEDNIYRFKLLPSNTTDSQLKGTNKHLDL